ncbi:alpha/beta hydrolase [Amycolatopsis sp. NPDC058986]|uniref:alpha/beta hydrolase n=1 Tax=unclassified Amycolatopsis TaxID=2618356 RepID=UPI003670CF34
MRKLTALPVVAAVVGAMVAGAAPALADAPGKAPGQPVVPKRFLEQKIDWKPGFKPGEIPDALKGKPGVERYEVGTMTVPQNWHHPDDGKTIAVAVSRIRNDKGAPRGSLVINPGGPGEPGLTMPLVFGKNQRTRMLDSFELVSFDPRGVGKSTHVSCGGALDNGAELDPRDRRPANIKAIQDANEQNQRDCQRAEGELGTTITTEQTDDDVDLLRALLGREKISWLGWSAGTWMGAHYATQFPARVDKFVLDANTNFTTDLDTSWSTQPMGFQRRFDVEFRPWAAKYDNVFHLGTTPAAITAAYESMRAALAAKPIDDPELGKLGAVDLDSLITLNLYSADKQFVKLGKALGSLKKALDSRGGDGIQSKQQLRADLDAARKPADDAKEKEAESTVFNTIMCNDTAWHGTRASRLIESTALGLRYPLMGWSWVGQICDTWKQPADIALPAPTGKGLPPILMVQNRLDPATPYEGAVAAHRSFENSRLVHIDGVGDHCVYLDGVPEIDNLVESYYLDGVTPPRDSALHVHKPLPVPTADGKADADRAKAASNPSVDSRQLTAEATGKLNL